MNITSGGKLIYTETYSIFKAFEKYDYHSEPVAKKATNEVQEGQAFENILKFKRFCHYGLGIQIEIQQQEFPLEKMRDGNRYFNATNSPLYYGQYGVALSEEDIDALTSEAEVKADLEKLNELNQAYHVKTMIQQNVLELVEVQAKVTVTQKLGILITFPKLSDVSSGESRIKEVETRREEQLASAGTICQKIVDNLQIGLGDISIEDKVSHIPPADNNELHFFEAQITLSIKAGVISQLKQSQLNGINQARLIF